MVSEIESAKDKAEQYAYIMEEKVKERTKQLEDMSRTDALTGLQNIRYFKESVVQALRSAQRRGEPLSLIYFDINDFKLINDNQGHQGGDETLRFVANAIRSIARIDDGCFRYGGDEFCIILNNCLATEAQTRFVDGLNQKLKAAPYTVSISCGISQSGPDDFIDAELLIQQADKKMYLAKKATKHNSEPDKEPKR
jgi:diguanylate cyclase (GGDEF)-like protein